MQEPQNEKFQQLQNGAAGNEDENQAGRLKVYTRMDQTAAEDEAMGGKVVTIVSCQCEQIMAARCNDE